MHRRLFITRTLAIFPGETVGKYTYTVPMGVVSRLSCHRLDTLAHAHNHQRLAGGLVLAQSGVSLTLTQSEA